MIKKHNKGSVLITVEIIFSVLIILGLSLLSMSSADATQAIRQEKSVQAYQVARSGIEIAIKKINDRVELRKTQKIYYSTIIDLIENNQDVFTGFSGSVSNSGSYNVTFNTSSQFTNKEMIKISSIGTIGSVNNSTALTLKIESPTINPTGWINNGWIICDGINFMNSSPVIFRTRKELGHTVMKTGNNAVTFFKAPSIYFLDSTSDGYSLELNKNSQSFTIESNLIVFNSKVIFQNDGTGKFYLDVYNNGTGLLNALGQPLKSGWGVVVFKQGVYINDHGNVYSEITENTTGTSEAFEGYYFFTGNLNIDDPAERVSMKLQKITDPSVIAYIDNIMANETSISVDIKDSIWSKN